MRKLISKPESQRLTANRIAVTLSLFVCSARTHVNVQICMAKSSFSVVLPLMYRMSQYIRNMNSMCTKITIRPRLIPLLALSVARACHLRFYFFLAETQRMCRQIRGE